MLGRSGPPFLAQGRTRCSPRPWSSAGPGLSTRGTWLAESITSSKSSEDVRDSRRVIGGRPWLTALVANSLAIKTTLGTTWLATDQASSMSATVSRAFAAALSSKGKAVSNRSQRGEWRGT